MTITDILAMCPTTGRSDIYGIFKQNTVECHIDQAFSSLIKSTETEMSGFYCGIYTAYVAMTTCSALWEDIWFMLKGASEWSKEEIDMYREGA